jgi:hypothetical protein
MSCGTGFRDEPHIEASSRKTPYTKEQIFAALESVRDALLSGEIVARGEGVGEARPQLDMGVPMAIAGRRSDNSPIHCGSVGCIGGWMFRALGENNPRTIQNQVLYPQRPSTPIPDELRAPLRNLFYPPTLAVYESITPVQAATAIDNLLRHGDPRWNEIDLDYADY